VDVCLPKDEAGNFIAEKDKSDVVHDLLAHLAKRMLEMNKQKLARRSKASWAGWRASSAPGSMISRRRPNYRATTSTYYEGFFAVLKKNRKKLTIDPAPREPWPLAESGGSVGKLLPLRERIERTDGRIDGCVAVGLTDEEIGIVGGISPCKQFHEQQIC